MRIKRAISKLSTTILRPFLWIRRRLRFFGQFLAFRKLARKSAARFLYRWSDRYPCLNDATAGTSFDRHYVYHTAWAARAVKETMPEFHFDISSSLYFIGIVSAFCPVHFFDYRPADLSLPGLQNRQADLLALPFNDESITSLSCMHVVEHIGLGRYGDSLDPDADLQAMKELRRVLAPMGNLLFVVPIGKPRVMFNAHRIYSYDQIRQYFSDLELHQFALIPENPRDGGLVYEAPRELSDSQTYGCGCFWFKKHAKREITR